MDRNAFLPGILLISSLMVLQCCGLPTALPPGNSALLISALACPALTPPPGYPLFIGLGRLFSLVPVETVAWRIAFMCALLNGVTLSLLYVHMIRTTKRILPALASTIFLGLSSTFLCTAFTAHVMALLTMMAALVTVLLFGDSHGAGLKRWYALAGVAGLSCAAHPFGILLVPIIAAKALQEKISLTAREYATAGAIFFSGLLPFLLIPATALRDPSLGWEPPDSLHSFLSYVTAVDWQLLTPGGTSPFGLLTIRALEAQCLSFMSLIKASMTVIVPACALLGWLTSPGNRKAFPALAGAVIFGPLLCAGLSVMPGSGVLPFLSLSSFFIALSAGWGVKSLLHGLDGCTLQLSQKARALCKGLFLFLLVLPLLIFQLPRALSVKPDIAEEYGRNICVTLPPRALLFSTSPGYPSLLYLRSLNQMSRDSILVALPLTTWRARLLLEKYPEFIGGSPSSEDRRSRALAEVRKYSTPEAFIKALVARSDRPVYFESPAVKECPSVEPFLVPEGLLMRYLPYKDPAVRLDYLESHRSVRERYSLSGLLRSRMSGDVSGFVDAWAASHNAAGAVYAMSGYYDLAEYEFSMALHLKPDYQAAQKNMDRVRMQRAQAPKERLR